MKNFLKKIAPYLLILIVVIISYGQTLGMYFWQDDSALIFKLQNQQPASGSFGVGIVGEGPYKYLVTPFVPFFPLFDLEPFGYFFVGFLTYILATFTFHLFVKKLFEDKKASYIATIIFAAGYVGSDIMFRVINSWQTNIGLILAFLTFEKLIDFLKTKSLKSYVLSIVLYFACSEFVFIRSHSLILPILFLTSLYWLIPFKLKKIVTFIFCQLPFLLIFKLKYLSDSSFGAPGISSLFKEIVIQGKVEKMSAFFANIGNVFIPTPVQSKIIATATKFFLSGTDIDSQVLMLNIAVFLVFLTLSFLIWSKYKQSRFLKIINLTLLISGLVLNLIFYNKAVFWYTDIQSVIAGLIGIEITFLITFWTIVLWKKYKIISVSLIFGFVFAASQVFGYYVQYSTAIFPTTHRYFSYALIGYAIFFASLYLLFKKNKQKKLILLLLSLVILPNLILGFLYQKELISVRSIPSRNFYSNLKKYVPKINKGDVFYFDIKNNPMYQRQFSDFFSVGSMPETTALAIYYGVDRYDVSMVTEFNELVYKMQTENLKSDQIHSFYYGEDGLVDTTQPMQRFLTTKSIFTPLPIAPLTIVDVELTLIATAEQNPVLPYLRGTKIITNLNLNQKLRNLQFLKNRQNFYKLAKVTTSSEWKYREVENITDGDPGTAWQGHRIAWGKMPQEDVVIDLGFVQNIDRLIWHNWDDTLSAVSYTIEVSQDGKTWIEVKKINDEDGKRDGEIVVETFNPTKARYVRLRITKTLSDDSPAIGEIMADFGFSDVNPAEAMGYLQNPFYGIKTIEEWKSVYTEFRSLASVSVNKINDKGDRDVVQQQIILDGKPHVYIFTLPSGGTVLSDIKITNSFPGKVDIVSLKARNLSFEEIQQRRLIKRFSTN